MLVPLTRQKFEQLIPRIATGPQYRYCWGNFAVFLRRVLISVVGVVIVWLLRFFVGESLKTLLFGILMLVVLYPLLAPAVLASLRNAEYRRYQYSGFFRGRILDVFITEELIGKEETVNKKGDLVIVENRERRINLEIGDETGFTTEIQVPLRRTHAAIAPNQIAEMVVLSDRPDLSRIAKVTDLYIPSRNLWVSDYPFLQRYVFVEVSRQLRDEQRQSSRRRSSSKESRQYNSN